MQDIPHLDESLAELTEFLALHPATAWLDALFVDLAGTLRGKRYPRDEMDKLFRGGMQFPVSAYYLDATGACLDPLGRGYSDGDPDATCWPLPGTLRPVPWGTQAGAQVLMGMHAGDGNPSAVEPRHLAVVESRDELGVRDLVALGARHECVAEQERDPVACVQPSLHQASGERIRGLVDLGP